jgi:Na+/melibiose symporter-like transporter
MGGPWFVAIFQLPQKFQIVHGVSTLGAGVRLMPFTFSAPVGAVVTSTIAGKLKVPPLYLIIIGSILQVIGFALLATLPGSSVLHPRTYGYEIIAGFGSGINGSLLLLMMPFAVEARDRGKCCDSLKSR